MSGVATGNLDCGAGRPAVVLLSGGLDSTTCLFAARRRGYQIYALSFDYGQAHGRELEAASAVAVAAGVAEHRVCRLDLGAFGGSALTDPAIPIPRGRAPDAIGAGVPVTYVPARNTIFLAHALAFAEVRSSRDIFIGVNQVDWSGYPDCRPEFIAAFERVAALGTRTGAAGERIRIHAPLVDLAKAEIIRLGIELGVDYGATRTCYALDEDGRGCSECDACQLRLAGFAAAGLEDPAPYRSGSVRPDRLVPEA